MRFLYIFPHPDDESFGAAGAMHAQSQAGHEVSLLTLTRGEATRIRFELGHSKVEMGKVRTKELTNAARILGVTDQFILEFPDGELADLDPRDLESAVERTIRAIQPHVVVTYPVHGVSGFHDHLVAHAVVKRVYNALKGVEVPSLQRLAYVGLRESAMPADHQGKFKLQLTPDNQVDCVVKLNSANVQAFHQALDAYTTYQKTIEASGVRRLGNKEVAFEFYRESIQPPVGDLGFGLKCQEKLKA